MRIGHIEGATRTLGAPAGAEDDVVPLAIRDVVLDGRIPAVVSAWFPTPDEVAKIRAGEPIYLTVMGTNMPPCYVGVKGDPV